jgi:hypothetical protein
LAVLTSSGQASSLPISRAASSARSRSAAGSSAQRRRSMDATSGTRSRQLSEALNQHVPDSCISWPLAHDGVWK